MLFATTFAFALYEDLLPTVFGGTSSQLQVKRDYVVCHYISDAANDSVNYRFGAYVQNAGSIAYNNDIVLNINSNSGSVAKWSKAVSVAAGDSLYFRIDFPVKKGDKLDLTMLDADGVAISEVMDIEIPEGYLEAPVYDKYELATLFSRNEELIMVPYDGDSIVCGDLALSYDVSSGMPCNMFLWPQTTIFDIRFNDVYGLDTLKIDCDDILEGIAMFETEEKDSAKDLLIKTILRGGQYELRAFVNSFGIDVKENVIMYDTPTLRYYTSGDIKTGENLFIKAAYNTGFPYTEEMVGRTYDSKINVTYIKPVEGQNPDTLKNFCSEQHTTKFDVEKYPLLAGIDTFCYEMIQPELGEYWFDFTSEFREGKRDNVFALCVEDSLRSEFDFPKNSFVHGSDTLATFHYKLDKKWPYLLNLMNDSIPSVHIVASCTKIQNDMTEADSLCCDSLMALCTHEDSLAAKAIVDSLVRNIETIGDSLLIPIGVNMPLNVEGDFTFSVNRCELDDSLNLTIYVKNIDVEDIVLPYRIYVSSQTDGIGQVNQPDRPESDAMSNRKYNLQGVPVTDDYRGVVVRRGKAYINK